MHVTTSLAITCLISIQLCIHYAWIHCVVTFQVDGNCYGLVQVQLVGNFSNQTTTLGPVIPNVTDTGSVEVIIVHNITTNEVYNVTVSDEQNPEVKEETSLSEFWSII